VPVAAPDTLDNQEATVADPTTTDRAVELEAELDRIREHRNTLKTRHSQALNKLMSERADLRGVHALADLVDDSLRWSA
jgi:uncharacterized protein YlxW (UPF0749 family)